MAEFVTRMQGVARRAARKFRDSEAGRKVWPPTVSVIVPFYGVEAYIGACVESILEQSFVHFELVLVDDGPQMSREQQRQVKALLAVFPATWRLGWHEPWRIVTDPVTDELPARIRRTVTEIRDRGISLMAPASGPTKEKK